MKPLKILCALILIPFSASYADLQPVDHIVALVNDSVIMNSELESRVQEIKSRYVNNLSVLPPDMQLKDQVLDQLILESIQVQLARKNGLIAPIDDINVALENYAKGTGTTVSQLLDQQPSLYQDIRQQVEHQILISLIQRREVSRRIQVNEREIEAFLNTNSGRALSNKEYRFTHARTQNPDEAQTWYQKAVQGTMLSELTQATDLEFRTRSKLPSVITQEKLVQAEQQGVIAPIEASDYFHVFQLTDTRMANTRTIRELLARHILIKPNVLLSDAQAKALAEELNAQLDNGASFDALAREFSDDVGSRVQGGELGWQDPNTYVPEFKTALEALNPGQRSDVVKSEFGYHLIELLDVRNRDISELDLKNQTTQAIFQNRFQQELPRWITEQQESAFVEIRM